MMNNNKFAPAPVHENSLNLRFGRPLRTVKPVELGASSNDSYAINPPGGVQPQPMLGRVQPMTPQQRVAEIVKSLKQKS